MRACVSEGAREKGGGPEGRGARPTITEGGDAPRRGGVSANASRRRTGVDTGRKRAIVHDGHHHHQQGHEGRDEIDCRQRGKEAANCIPSGQRLPRVDDDVLALSTARQDNGNERERDRADQQSVREQLNQGHGHAHWSSVGVRGGEEIDVPRIGYVGCLPRIYDAHDRDGRDRDRDWLRGGQVQCHGGRGTLDSVSTCLHLLSRQEEALRQVLHDRLPCMRNDGIGGWRCTGSRSATPAWHGRKTTPRHSLTLASPSRPFNVRRLRRRRAQRRRRLQLRQGCLPRGRQHPLQCNVSLSRVQPRTRRLSGAPVRGARLVCTRAKKKCTEHSTHIAH